MEALKKIIESLKRRSGAPPAAAEALWNTAREYLQVLVLKLIYQSPFGGALSFMGGTSLRICYDLKRYSEDLDFALDDPKRPYSFLRLLEHLQKELRLSGLGVSANVHEDKIVQKAFLKIAGLPEALDLRGIGRDQKLHVKLEVDIRPPPLGPGDRESFFISRFGEIFPVLKHTLPTLFSGKVLAILYRPYARGRDYYDLIWYLAQKTPLNLDYVNRGMKGGRFGSAKEVFLALQKKIAGVKPEIILKDIERFLENPEEAGWISNYQKLFAQCTGLAFP